MTSLFKSILEVCKSAGCGGYKTFFVALRFFAMLRLTIRRNNNYKFKEIIT